MTTREVVLDGGSPWGFRLHGGADLNQPLRISRVNPGSKAALRGIREGDFITSINNQSTKDISNAEAHALLRNSGDTLKLGLNEDTNGSPKRRQYKTVHQETHSETVKKSSVTSYTITSKSVSQGETSNEHKTSNGNTNGIDGDSNHQNKNTLVSQKSTLSSTCSSSSSTPSTYTSPSGTGEEPLSMADNGARSRRRRARNQRRKAKNTHATIVEEEYRDGTRECHDDARECPEEARECRDDAKEDPVEATEYPDDAKECPDEAREYPDEYRVDSPKTLPKKQPVKSRSLDDDDVKIQELSEVSESEDKECKAIVSEAESDVEWETAASIAEPQPQTGSLSSLSLVLEKYTTEPVSLISPEEELNLRNFLEGLNLVNSPEDAFRACEASTMESVKSRRARKRAALEQYFAPIAQNPRFLDVISEETSDLSDRELSVTQHLKQGTPEPEVPPPPRPRKTRRVITNPAILVGTKIIDVPSVTHEICSGSALQSSSEAEVVYLEEDSSNSTTPDPKSDNEDEKDTNDDLVSSTSSVPDLKESEVVEETKQVKVTVKRNDVLVSASDSVEKKCDTSVSKRETDRIEVRSEISAELTPPPTPDDVSPKNEIAQTQIVEDRKVEDVESSKSTSDVNKAIEGRIEVLRFEEKDLKCSKLELSEATQQVSQTNKKESFFGDLLRKNDNISEMEDSTDLVESSVTDVYTTWEADRNKSTSKASLGVKVDSSRDLLLSDVVPIEGGTDIEVSLEGKDSILKADNKTVPEVNEAEDIEWTVSALTPKDTVDVKIEDKESLCSKLEQDEPPESISSSNLNDSTGVRVSSSTNKNVVVLPLKDVKIEDEDLVCSKLEVDETPTSASISEVNNSKELIASNIDKNATVLPPKGRKVEDKENLVCSKLELDESSKSVSSSDANTSKGLVVSCNIDKDVEILPPKSKTDVNIEEKKDLVYCKFKPKEVSKFISSSSVNKPNEREVSWSKGERKYDNSHMETSSANFILDQDKNTTSKHFTKESYKCETQKETINKRSVDVMSRSEKAADSKLSSRTPSVHVEEISKEMKDPDGKLSSKPVHTTLDEATHSKLSPRVHVVEIRKEMEDPDEKSFSKPIHTTSDKATDSKLSPKVHIVEIRKEMEDLDKKSVSEPIHTTSDKAADSKLSPKVHIVKIRKKIEDSEEKSFPEPIHTTSDKAADFSKLSPKVHIVEIRKEMEDSDKKSVSEPIHTTSDKAADPKLSPKVHIVEICKEVEDSDEKSFSKPVHTTLDKAANGKLSSRTSSVHIVESRKEVKDSNEISVSKPVHVILDKTADSKLSPRILKEEIRKEMNDLTGKLFSKPVLTTLDKAADSKLSSKTPSVRIVEIRKEMEDTKEKLFSKPVHATTDNAAESKLSPKVHIVKIRKEIEDSEEKSFSTPIHTTLDKSADPKLSPKVHIVEIRKEKEDSDEKLFSKPVHTTTDETTDTNLSPKVHIVEIRKEVEDSTEKLFTTPAHTALDKAADSKFSPKVHIVEIRKEVEDSNEKLFSKPTHTSLDKAADSKLSPKVHIVEIRKEVEDSKEKLFSKPIHTTVDEAADSKLSPKVHIVEIRKEVEGSNGKLPSKPDYTTLDKAADSKLSPKVHIVEIRKVEDSDEKLFSKPVHVTLEAEKFSKSASELKKAKQIESPSKDLNKEIENICSSLRLPESIVYSNVVSPPAPSPSPSLSSGSSSRATSLCTAKYNPMSSSIADMDSINDNIDSPRSLRELCIHNLMSHPFGSDILQELADVSSSIEHLTNNLLAPANLPAFMRKPSNGNVDLPAKDKWVGLATEGDPRVLICLSPTQRSQLDKSKKVGDEASKLLDLHEKFIYRTGYHDAVERQAKSEMPSIKADVSNRLLAIIRDAEEPHRLSARAESARLHAKDLSEWLQLARNKSTSESDLTKDENRMGPGTQRRTSLPQEFYEHQMRYLEAKEREIQRELEMLEEEKQKLTTEMVPTRHFHLEDYHISRRGDFAETKKSRPLSMPAATEFFRRQMYDEYMGKIAAMEERKQQKVIKVTPVDASLEAKSSQGIQDEFMDKVKQKQKMGKLGRDESDEDRDLTDGNLPKHLKEFIDIAQQAAENSAGDGVWSPGQKQEFKLPEGERGELPIKDEPISPVWTPKSATSSPTVERKEFRPVKFESPVLSRKGYSKEEPFEDSKEPPWKVPERSSDTGVVLASTLQKRLPTSHSSPASGFNDLPTTRLPRAQNPTITLLQKAREGQLPKGAAYIEQEQSVKRAHNEKPPHVGPGEILYKIKNEYTSESDSERPRKMADLGPRQFEGIGPTTRDGMPLILRSQEVKDANQSKWYKKMYDTIHKQKPHRDDYVTVRYKQRRAQYPYTSGYLSEPEPGAYDSDFADYKYATLDRRRLPARDKENEYSVPSTMPRSAPERVGASVIKHGHDPYKNQPGRIENYIPGHSSISEKEAKEWWDEVMDIFDGWLDDNSALPSYDYMFSRALAKSHLEQQKRVPQTKSFINQALKESGYESDSTLVFRRRDDTAQQLSPSEQKEAYKIIQKGGDIPLHGLRKPAPERPKESPRKYVENEVTIHYKTPVRQEIKEYLSEDELAYRQAEAMKKIYQEERRRKYLQVSKSLQELQDMNNRRHTDNFIPSQKSPIPLNRYDDFEELSPPVKPRPRSPEPRLLARALYNFVGQTARELTFRKGDLIYVRRQVDKNWYEGELNAMVGLFPVNYVEIVTYDTAKTTPRKSHEGQARAKYNFVAQTHLELSLAKGELVVITRRVDDNWFEGKIGGRKGIFPVSYVDVLIDASDPPPPSSKPVAAPAAHSLLLNGSSGGKESMGSHSYTPSLSSTQLTTSYHAKPVQVTSGGSYGSLNRAKNPVSQALHIETQSEPIPISACRYRAMFKYLPQNDDELELLEGDTVYVLEKCDDGWYVGSSDRTGAFGTFPGNYVEKI
ncbi:uncharacterized protein [Tenebrio molitor]|uniref:uncharacterized protein isoform X6 n=1 Tax=Tenebrio molitor TaxID=7067 RepID=UPI003624A5E3